MGEKKITREIRKYFQLNENLKNNISKCMTYNKNSAKRKFYSFKCVFQRKKNFKANILFPLIKPEKVKQTKPKIKGRKCRTN